MLLSPKHVATYLLSSNCLLIAVVPQRIRDAQEAEAHRKEELSRRLRPLCVEDFETLKRELEAWRLKETSRIKESKLPLDEEHAALQQLLHKETKLLQTIDRLRINANHDNKQGNIQKQLQKMAKPKKWQAANGIQVRNALRIEV